MTQSTEISTAPAVEEQPWPEDVNPPPTDLPYDDGEPMESPWHASSGPLLKASYAAARGGRLTDFFVGVNMFVYFSWQQVRNKDYKGPDLFIVKNVDGARHRLYWAIWDEDGRYPDVIVELLSESTEREDLGAKKQLYEQTFHTPEYFCVAPQVERLMGWRLTGGRYEPIVPNERGWLWSEELGLWLGPWEGYYLAEHHTWLRLYTADGDLVLLPDEAEHERAEAERERAEAERERAEAEHERAEAERERAEAERERAEAERERADELAARLAELEAELNRLRGGTPSAS
jgi:Uma2 family endonuclease